MFSGLDWFPTLLAAAGDTTVKDRLLKGWQPAGSDTPSRTTSTASTSSTTSPGKSPKSARNEFYYFNDDGDLVATRYGRLEGGLRRAARPGRLRGLGESVHRVCASRRCSTCAWIRTSAPMSFPTSTTTGSVKNAYMIGRRHAQGGRLPRDVRRVSAEPASGELQHRSDPRRRGQGDRRVVQEARHRE